MNDSINIFIIYNIVNPRNVTIYYLLYKLITLEKITIYEYWIHDKNPYICICNRSPTPNYDHNPIVITVSHRG